MANVFVLFGHACIFENDKGELVKKDNINGIEMFSMSGDRDVCTAYLNNDDVQEFTDLSSSGNFNKFKTHFKSKINSDIDSATHYYEGRMSLEISASEGDGEYVIFYKSGLYNLNYVVENFNEFYDDEEPSFRPGKTYFAKNTDDEFVSMLNAAYKGSLFPTAGQVIELYNSVKKDTSDKITLMEFKNKFIDEFKRKYRFFYEDLFTIPQLSGSKIIKIGCSTVCTQVYDAAADRARVRLEGGKRRTRERRSRRLTSTKRKNHVKRHSRRRLW
jgi:hypothetical protein